MDISLLLGIGGVIVAVSYPVCTAIDGYAVRVSHNNLGLTPTAHQTDLAAALRALESEFELRVQFPAEVLAETQRAITDFELPPADRTDIEFVTIDPAESTDLDQAVHLQRGTNGYVVHYAIADVPGFVALGGALDDETRLRGQTLYLPHRRLSLHPEAIAEDAGSLLPDQDRSAYLWTFTLDEAGEVIDTALERAIVRSRQKLSYIGVQADLDAGTASDLLVLLREVGLKRIELERLRGGASLRIPAQEVECVQGQYQLLATAPLPVEDWNAQISLLTGMEAARIMLAGGVGILRTMPAPLPKDLEIFRLQAKTLGAEWAREQPYGEFLRSLDLSKAGSLALMHQATSLFRGATYTVLNGQDPQELEQAAIGAPYAHTTAPLRRLIDRFSLIVCSFLVSGRHVPDAIQEVLPLLPKLMGSSNQLANKVERAAIDTVEAATLAHRIGERFAAVTLTGTIKPGSKADHDATGTQTGPSNGKNPRGTLQLLSPAVSAPFEGAARAGQDVEVELVSADLLTRMVLFRIVQ
ncbi:ribonuclease II [Arthrobacter sp. MYb227]|uniref:RNB domain-containing ribonuclease n=1 Tax=Arthrobacter sp. MYb227 TaxID=1848601 RepID=UPI000CFCD674|nr:RNB domain-containing ribonuclease [Arthrobacter sp. MYb227]PQZ95952.1 ribonuclease II [Arthrobacter sp. MYb227]